MLNSLKEAQKLTNRSIGFSKFFFENKYENYEIQMRNFKKACEKGVAILFVVFGGKFAEGMNFKDSLARIAIIVGIPFANIKSKEIMV